MDPEDLLQAAVAELPGLEGHCRQNSDTLQALAAMNVTFRYTRLGVAERYGTQQAEQMAIEFNKAVEQTQKIRMAPVVDGIDVDEDNRLASTTAEDFSAGTVSDDGDL